MNTNHQDSSVLPASLAPFVAALRDGEVPASAADGANARLAERMSHVRPVSPRARRATLWLGAAGFATLLAAVVLPALLMRPSTAFAQVQQHFRDFSTLTMRLDTKVTDDMTMTTMVRVDKAGNVRVDVDKTLSVIINAERGETVQLLHDAKMASVRALARGEITRDDSLDWLDDLRKFQGTATQLEETREYDGRLTHGYRVKLDAMDITLWADADGMPLAMDLSQGDVATQAFRFTFDAPMAADTFATTIPAGYSTAGPETDG
jgi:hypothetical protein